MESISARFPSPLTHQQSFSEETLRGISAQLRHPNMKRRLGLAWVPSHSIRPQDDDDTWVKREDLKSLDDVCTKFCTRHFFPNAFARVNMVGNVVRFYNAFAKLNRLRYKIIFKGGVMLRLVLLQFWRNFPDDASHLAIEYLDTHKAIGLGDFDFEIVPDEHDLSPERKYTFLYLNTFALIFLQKHLLRELASGASGMLQVDWDRKAAEEGLKEQIQAELDALPAEHPLHKARAERVVAGSAVADPPKGFATRGGKPSLERRRNIFIFRLSDGTTAVTDAATVARECGMDEAFMREAGVTGRANDYIYTTCNMHINETPPPRQRTQELNPHFHLVRIKHTFTLYYTTKDGEKRCDRLAGEMIDLSMGDPTDEIRNWKHRVMPEGEFRDYPLLGVPELAFRSYTPTNFLKDHEQMLHLRETSPWAVPKYSKRIVRYIAFLIVVVLSEEQKAPLVSRVRALLTLQRWLHTDLAAKMPRTASPTVDHFADVEFASVAADRPHATEYVETLRGHMDAFVRIALRALQKLRDPDPRFLDVTHYDYLNEHTLQ